MSTGFATVLRLEDESEIRDVMATLAEHARAIAAASYVTIEIGRPDEQPVARRASGTPPTSTTASTITVPIVHERDEIARCIVSRARPFSGAEHEALTALVNRFAPVAARIRETALSRERPARAKHLAMDGERLRQDWTAIVAHDLRQPTGAIAVFTRLLANRIGECSELKHIEVACKRLERQIDDLLDASAIETDQLKLELENVDLRALIDACVERLSATTRDLSVRVRAASGTPRVRVDPLRIEQVLENLLLNARKYGEPGAAVELAVEPRGADVEIAVTNRGPGISASDLPQIFDRFRRTARARASSTGGLGLGLYIVQGLVAAHGGTVTVESTPGESTTFRFTVRAAEGDDDVAYPRCG
jgi:signal transduction histidine kinase